MRKLITTLACTLFAVYTYAQLEVPAAPITYDLKFSIENNTGDGLKVIKKDTAVLPDGIISIQTKMSDADLVLQAKVKAPKKNKEVQKFKLVLRDKNGMEIIPALSDYVNYNENANKKIHSNTIIWKNITEDNSFLANEYTLTYYVEKYIIIGVDCDKPPKFGIEQQIPYIAGLAIGGHLINTSRHTKDNSQRAFELAERSALQYTQGWEEGRAVDEIASLSDLNKKELERGTDLNKKQKRQFIAGAIVLGADLVAYITHRIIYKRKKKLYDEYCVNKDPKVKIKPVIDVGAATSYTPQIGLGLTYTFGGR